MQGNSQSFFNKGQDHLPERRRSAPDRGFFRCAHKTDCGRRIRRFGGSDNFRRHKLLCQIVPVFPAFPLGYRLRGSRRDRCRQL